jgi:hypothetical protein
LEKDIASRLGRGFRNLLVFLYLALLVGMVWGMIRKPPPTTNEKERDAAMEKARQQADRYKNYLCLAAAACRKYNTVRLECATAEASRHACT